MEGRGPCPPGGWGRETVPRATLGLRALVHTAHVRPGPPVCPVGSENLSKGRGEIFPLELGPRSPSLAPVWAARGSLTLPGFPALRQHGLRKPAVHSWEHHSGAHSRGRGHGGEVDVPPGRPSLEAAVRSCGLGCTSQAPALVPPCSAPGLAGTLHFRGSMARSCALSKVL